MGHSLCLEKNNWPLQNILKKEFQSKMGPQKFNVILANHICFQIVLLEYILKYLHKLMFCKWEKHPFLFKALCDFQIHLAYDEFYLQFLFNKIMRIYNIHENLQDIKSQGNMMFQLLKISILKSTKQIPSRNYHNYLPSCFSNHCRNL